MIIIDLNQVIFSAVATDLKDSSAIDENAVRLLVLNSIRNNVKKFKSQYNAPVVIACDSRKFWRRDVFPPYKANRKKDREKSNLDWPTIFQSMNKIRDELKEFAPYKVLEIDGAEADDIIAVLCKANQDKPVLVLSTDKDFVQLHKYPNVHQYSPIKEKYITTADPVAFLKELIIRGDKDDGIPNILSEDDTFISGGRQKSMTSKRLEEYLSTDPDTYNMESQRNFARNRMLIDFDSIPEYMSQAILDAYNASTPKTKAQFMNYLIQKGAINLIEKLDEF